jgi:hypothetical protein
MVMAELNVRHTRRHQPYRRVALDPGYLPTNGNAYGAVLLGAVVSEFFVDLDDEQQEVLPRFVREARKGDLGVPRIALRYRLQVDIHGLDRSRHRFLAEPGRVVIELDVHGRGTPQVIGALMAAAAMGPTSRSIAFRAIDAALARPGELPEGVEIRRLLLGVPGAAPPPPGSGFTGGTGTASGFDPEQWRNVPSERRWAMEVLGLHADTAVERADVQRRFRRLLRVAHPDQGGTTRGAAERIAELREARELLLVGLAADPPVAAEEAAPA